MRIALLAHLHHPIAEPFSGGTEMHTSLVADELVRRGHQVTLFAKGGSETTAHLVPLVGADFVFGQMPGPAGTGPPTSWTPPWPRRWWRSGPGASTWC